MLSDLCFRTLFLAIIIVADLEMERDLRYVLLAAAVLCLLAVAVSLRPALPGLGAIHCELASSLNTHRLAIFSGFLSA